MELFAGVKDVVVVVVSALCVCISTSHRSRVWKRLRVSGAHWCSVCDSHVLQ